jgi:dipeptidyl aminopeptidase/acylaminoacyl peptidase
VWVIPATGGSPVRVTDEQSLNTSPAWLPRRGSLLYVSNRDGGRDIYQVALTRTGRPAKEASRLTTGSNAAQVTVSADGRRLAYAAFTETGNVWSLTIPSSGTVSVSRAEPVTSGTQFVEAFDISPDGRWLTFDSDRGGTHQIYRMPLSGGEVEQLTTGAEPAMAPAYSHDGRELAYHGLRSGTRQVFVIPAEGGTPRQVTRGNGQNRMAQWSPDGRRLTFVRDALTAAQETDVVTRDSSGNWGPPRTLVKGGDMAFWEPGGRWVLTSMKAEAGKVGIAIVPVNGGVPRIVVAPGDLTEGILYGASLSRDGRFVYYLGRDAADQKPGLWRLPAAGGAPRLMVRFDDPSKHMPRPWFRVQGSRFYFRVADEQSDIWTTELLGSR